MLKTGATALGDIGVLGRVVVGLQGTVGITHGPVMCYPNKGEIPGWMREASKSHNITTRVYVHKGLSHG